MCVNSILKQIYELLQESHAIIQLYGGFEPE